MPPEQLPWDRRDFRKHERSASDPRFGGGGFGGGGPHRWREQHHHTHAPPPPYHHHHQQQQRWYSDFRSSRPIPSSHSKQGGWHVYPDDAGHGFLPFGSRYSDRHLEDDNFQPLGSRNDGRYFRTNRENRGSFSQKDWRSSWEPAATSGGPGRPTAEVSNQKSVDNSETWQNNNSKSNGASHSLPDSMSNQSLHMKEHERNDGTADGGASSVQKPDKESGLDSVDWKPVKWTRSGSLPSRGSGFNNLSGNKSTGAESIETVPEVQQKSAVPVQSRTSNAMSTVPASSDENSCRKKPRLGWGEGLAKYEKKKVEGPEDGAMKDGIVVSVTTTETVQSPSVHLFDKSPRVATMLDCASPATPSSVACSSSPGTEEKESIRPANVDQENANLSCSPGVTSRMHYAGSTSNLESTDLSSIAKLSSFISELLQSEDPSAGETDYVQTTSMKKLLVWKVDILKALEVTESKIDSLETELKSMIAEPRSCCPCPATSSFLTGECPLKPCEELGSVSASTADPVPSQGVSSGSMNVENMPAAVAKGSEALKNEGINSSGGGTFKIVEPSGEDSCPPGTAECEGFVNLDSNNSSDLKLLCLENGLSKEIKSCHVYGPRPISDSCQNAIVGDVYYGGNHNYDSIVASNKDSASSALEELNKLLPSRHCFFDISIASIVSPHQRNPSRIKEKFLVRKRSLKFKEKVIMIKFRVFQHFWKEGRMVSITKLRGKSQKMLDMSQSGHKKNRSSSRLRIPCFAWNHQTASAEEVIKFINGLLSDSSFKPCRNTLKMPALILDKDMKMSRFISNNGLVEDPCAAEKERSIINPWTAEERELFIDKLAIFGKNFRKIALFLEHKTIADCIEFYYKNQKSECFARARKKPEFSEQRKPQTTTYLVATGKRWNREVNAASLNVLGEASRGNNGPLQRSNSLEIYSNETVAADVLAGICGSLSSEAMNSCITSSFDHADGYPDWKCSRVGSGSKRALTPDCTQNVDDEWSDESCEDMDSTDWTDEEKSIFIQAVSSYGKDFDMIAQLVRTKSKEQCKIFFSKARKCLGLDQIRNGARHAVSGDANGGGSDIEDGCVVQTNSIISNNNGSECKMEEDIPLHHTKGSHKSDVGEMGDYRLGILPCTENSNHCLDSVAAETVLENSLIGDGLPYNNPVADYVSASKGKSDGACASELEGLSMSSRTESVQVEVGGRAILANETNEVDKDALPDNACSCEGENGDKGLILHDSSDTVKVEDRDANSGDLTAISCARSEMISDPQLAGNVSVVDALSSMQVESGSQIQADFDKFSSVKSCVVSSHGNGCFTSMDSAMMFSVPITLQRHKTDNALVNVGVSGIGGKHSLETVKTRDSHSQSDTIDSLQILRGYPVSGQSVMEINGDINFQRHAVQHVTRWGGNLHADQHGDFSILKCSRSTPLQSHDKSGNDNSGPTSGCSSDLDKPSRNGNVKLFGKVLISSQQKPNSCVQETCSDNTERHKAGCQSPNLRSSGDLKATFDSSVSKFDCNNKFISSENIPVRSYGFPEGNKAPMSIPSVPDSSILLTKYPAAFSNHSKPTGTTQLSSLQGVSRSSSECPLNGITVVARNGDLSSSNGVADYQVLQNRGLQCFTKDMKQRQDVVFSEMQWRNGFNPVQEVQHEARGVVGIDVGAECSSVSDPVIAIKMQQYGKAQNIIVQAGNVFREDDNDDTWKSNGNVGR